MSKLNFVIFSIFTLIIAGCSLPQKVDNNTITENNNGNNEIEMVDVVSLSYSDAYKLLTNSGFTNITTNSKIDINDNSWFVTSQNITPGSKINPAKKIELICNKLCKLYIDIKSEDNLILNKYDIMISLDDSYIGTVKNGENFSYLAEIVNGTHELQFYKVDDTSITHTETIIINDNMTYICDISHGSNKITTKNVKTQDNINGANLTVSNVTNMILSEAKKTLSENGFINVKDEPHSSIWNDDNWIVIKQNIPAGTIADKNTYIQLDCVSLDEYYSDLFIDKNIKEIQEIATSNNISLEFRNNTNINLNNIDSMDDETKTDWISIDVKKSSENNKRAVITLKYNGIVEQNQTTESQIENQPDNNTNDSVYYSTNDKDTVKNGNSGKYSYKSIGGSYDIYYIIDFDEGYVYRFIEGNGDAICDRVAIVSGNLNDMVIITYHDGTDVWSNALNFKWRKQPDHLILQDGRGGEFDFYPTDLEKAQEIMKTKTIYNY